MTIGLRNVLIAFFTTVLLVLVSAVLYDIGEKKNHYIVRMCYIYQGDGETPYTANFMQAQKELEKKFAGRLRTKVFYNVREENVDAIYDEVIRKKPDIVFANSYGYDSALKLWAKKNPKIQFYNATGDLANEGDFVPNFHNCMGCVSEARYVSGVVAGMKLRELIERGIVDESCAYVGYVAAFPFAEVISGFTAFFLGVRSVVPSARMKVSFVNSWSDYFKEKTIAKKLVASGCAIISQHSDTMGPAIACQEENGEVPAFHVGYNDSMIDVAPTTTLVSMKINWVPFETAVVNAFAKNCSVEKMIDAETYGNDSWAGFSKGWVEIIDVNKAIIASGTEEAIYETVEKIKNHQIDIFSGNYTGTNPLNKDDTINLGKKKFVENEYSSSPKFKYILDDLIEIIE